MNGRRTTVWIVASWGSRSRGGSGCKQHVTVRYMQDRAQLGVLGGTVGLWASGHGGRAGEGPELRVEGTFREPGSAGRNAMAASI